MIASSTLHKNLRIGLLGGSFNPPHEGHVHISLTAQRMLKLDAVWWLVSPQNPLKSTRDTAPYETRFERCLEITRAHPSIIVSDFEKQHGCTRTYDTLKALLPRYPATSFVWVAGHDNALSFHRWANWRGILGLLPAAFIARPPAYSIVRNSKLRMAGVRQTVLSRPAAAELSAGRVYWIFHGHTDHSSSTLLRSKIL